MNIQCISRAEGQRPAGQIALRIGLSLVLMAALYGCAADVGRIPFMGLPLLVGGGCAALLAGGLQGRRAALAAWVLAGLLAAGWILAPHVRTGAAVACNALFSASEEANAYVYVSLSVPAEADVQTCLAAFGCWLAALAGGIGAGIIRSRSAAAPLAGAFLVITAESYFGVVPEPIVQLALFGALGAAVIRRMTEAPGWRAIAAAAAVAVAVALLVMALWPGVHPRTEAVSERIRDWLSGQQPEGTTAARQEEASLNHLRQETLLTQERAAEGAQQETVSGYERQQKLQRDISDPSPVDYIRILLLLLLVVVVLVGPFVPFVWLNRKRRRALARREVFDAAEPAEAIAEMFRHIVCCLTTIGVRPDSRGFGQLEGQQGPGLTAEYWLAYHQGLLLWQEAYYSDHPMTEAQRAQIKSLLQKTQQLVYELANRRQRFRLQYIDGLILAEELE